MEANISIRPKKLFAGKKLGTKVELKNINSFKAVKDAIGHEIERQKELLEKGEAVRQATRGWNENKKESFPQRFKEEAADYRYMPEPDLPPIDFDKEGAINLQEIKESLPELPHQKRVRFAKEYRLAQGSDELERLVDDRGEAEFFEEFVSELKSMDGSEVMIKLGVNYLDSDLVGIMKEEKTLWDTLKITPENFAELIKMVGDNKLSSRSAKDVLREMFVTGDDPGNIVGRMDLTQITDEEAIVDAIRKTLDENAPAVADFHKGKETALQFLIGQSMAKLRGRGNPQLVEKLLREHLSK